MCRAPMSDVKEPEVKTPSGPVCPQCQTRFPIHCLECSVCGICDHHPDCIGNSPHDIPPFARRSSFDRRRTERSAVVSRELLASAIRHAASPHPRRPSIQFCPRCQELGDFECALVPSDCKFCGICKDCEHFLDCERPVPDGVVDRAFTDVDDGCGCTEDRAWPYRCSPYTPGISSCPMAVETTIQFIWNDGQVVETLRQGGSHPILKHLKPSLLQQVVLHWDDDEIVQRDTCSSDSDSTDDGLDECVHCDKRFDKNRCDRYLSRLYDIYYGSDLDDGDCCSQCLLTMFDKGRLQGRVWCKDAFSDDDVSHNGESSDDPSSDDSIADMSKCNNCARVETDDFLLHFCEICQPHASGNGGFCVHCKVRLNESYFCKECVLSHLPVGDCHDGKQCQLDEFDHCTVCCECKQCVVELAAQDDLDEVVHSMSDIKTPSVVLPAVGTDTAGSDLVRRSTLPNHHVHEFLAVLDYLPVSGVAQIVFDYLHHGDRVATLPAGQDVSPLHFLPYKHRVVVLDPHRVAFSYVSKLDLEQRLDERYGHDNTHNNDRVLSVDGRLSEEQWKSVQEILQEAADELHDSATLDDIHRNLRDDYCFKCPVFLAPWIHVHTLTKDDEQVSICDRCFQMDNFSDGWVPSSDLSLIHI